MLHLFNKIYLDTEQKIDVQQNRAVISEKCGHDLAYELKQLSLGQSIYNSTFLDIEELPSLLLKLKNKSEETNKKCVIYADSVSFMKIAAIWFKSNTNFTKEEFVFWLKAFIHIEKFSTNYYVDPSYLNNLLNYIDVWDDVPSLNLNLGEVNYSYEFYFASYIYNKEKSENLKKILSLFMRRSYTEIFIDVKNMLMTNILDPRLQQFLGGNNKTLDNYKELPKLEIFLDESIWQNDKPFQVSGSTSFNWKNLTNDTTKKLTETITDLHNNYENFVYDSSNLSKWSFVPYLLNKDLNDEELEEVVNDLLLNRGDMNFIAKTDYVNANIVLWTNICNLKNSNEMEKLFNYTLK